MSKRRRLLIFVVFILVALASIRIGSIHPVGMSIWQLLLAIGGVYLFVFYCQRYSFIESDQNVPFCQVPQDRASRLQVFAGGKNRISARQAKIFAMSIVTPTEMRQRLVETYVLEHRTIRQRVSIEVQIPVQLESDPKEPIYFPVLIPIKGKFQDNFSLFGADGAALPVLSYREYLELAATTLRLLLATAYDSQTPFLLRPPIITIEHAAVSGIIHKRQPDGSIPWSKGWKRILKVPPQDKKGLTSRNLAAEFARCLARNYAIVAIARPDNQGRFLLKYEQTLVPELKISSLRRRLGIFLGARPIDLIIPLDNASTCQSYHMRVIGDDGLYLDDQRLLDAKKTLEAGRSRRKRIVAPPNIRFRKRLGQSYAHFYARFFPASAAGERPCIRFRYAEVPPGSSLRAAISAIAALALILIVGIINSRNPDPDTDAPAFLLAFPAVVATWIGFDVPTRRLLEGTLTARLSLIATVALSVLATGLYMAHRAFSTHSGMPQLDSSYVVHWYSLPGQASVLWVTDISWAILVLAALLNAIHMTVVYLFRTWRFARFSSRSQESVNDLVQNG